MSETIELAKLLLSKPSLTPLDEGCQALMSDRLSKINFQIEQLKFGEVENFWALRGNTSPVFVFAGHTDVVPVGENWKTDPFNPEIIDGMLYARGAADMKGSLAAMVVATERFVKDFPDHQGSIGFLITSN